MSSVDFDLVTTWSLAAPLTQVWAALTAPEEWPSWWPSVVRVERLAEGDADGTGAVRRMTWRTALPYTLTFDMKSTRVEPMTVIEGRALGELDGVGRWTLSRDDGATRVRYDWRVRVTRPWMRAIAPLARPVFAWNHGVVMERGYLGLVRKLA